LPVLFGKFESSLWNQDEITIAQRTKPNKTPTISTAGIDKALASQHYKIIIADDLINRQTISTKEQRDKVIKYYSDLLDLLEPDGVLIIIGTRWHDADLYGWIIEKEKEKFDIYIRKALENDEVIFPKKFSKSLLEELKSSKGTWEFSAQYMNECVPEDSAHFKPPFRYWTDLGENAVHYVTVDLAISEKTNADYTVVMDCAVNGSNQLCVVEYCRRRMTPQETIEKIFEFAMKYKARKVGIESVAYQRALVHIVDEEKRKRNIFFESVPIMQHKDKFTRVIALQPRWESGNLLLKQGMVELEEEMVRFPLSSHDDTIDALAMQLQILEPQYLTRPKVYIPPKYRAVA
jgi:predicted phage terminase large subunit-like protein